MRSTRRFKAWHIGFSLLLGTLGWPPSPLLARPVRQVADRMIVKFRHGATPAQRQNLRRSVDGTQLRELKLIGAEVVKLRGKNVAGALAVAQHNPNVVYAEPDWEVDILETVPNDPRFAELYALHNTGQTGGTPGADIGAPIAWDITTGDASVKVGVIDTGVDYTHPDLAANMWTNQAEAAGATGVDDDGNGYVDDIHGYDFVNDDGDPMDDHSHGTHVAGTIAAVGNNGIGIVGVDWHCQIVAIKFLNAGGSGTVSDAVQAIQYAIAVGVQLTNNSWGGVPFSQALLDAIDAAGAANQVFVAAAGNDAENTDLSPHYPSCFDSPYVFAVAATDQDDQLASFSNFGAATVDIAAPGKSILSTVPGGEYAARSGTSMAAPHVAGVCALLRAARPNMPAAVVKDLVMAHSDPVPALEGFCASGGRLNARGPLMTVADTVAPGAVTNLLASNPTASSLQLTWTASGDDGATGRCARIDLRHSTAPIDADNFTAAPRAPCPVPLASGSQQTFEVSDLEHSTLYYFAFEAFDEWGNSSMSNVTSARTLGIPILTAAAFPEVEVASGAQTTRALQLGNTGAATLQFNVLAPDLLAAPPDATSPNKATSERGDQPGLTKYGGPDGFRYRWTDSDQLGGPEFEWVDITGVGTLLQFNGNQTVGPIDVGFDFPFYGQVLRSVRVCGYGWLAFTNQTLASQGSGGSLPSTNSPENILAPYWGDLNPSPATGARAYVHTDGTRFVVSWHGMHRVGGTGDYTFQAILYPSGEVRFQYLTMVAPIQLGKTIGMQGNYRTGAYSGFMVASPSEVYVHDALAVRMLSVPQWLSIQPTSGQVPPGGQVTLTVTYDATSLAENTYGGSVHITTNEPEPEHHFPVTLRVGGQPEVDLPSAAIDYGVVYVGQSATRTVPVSNQGTGTLSVTAISSTHPHLTVAPQTFTVAPGATQNVTLTYAPTAPSTLAATLAVANTDPDESLVTVAVNGSANYGPQLSSSPDGLAVRIPEAGGMETRTFRLSNRAPVSGEPLQFTIVPTVDKPGAEARPMTGRRSRLTAQGGSGDSGYKWKDSEAEDGPRFGWLDIVGLGTRLNGSISNDDGVVTLPLPFAFPFYGSTYNALRVCTNGWLSFADPSPSPANQNTALPSTSAPGNLLAPFWDDLQISGHSMDTTHGIYYYATMNRVVVSYVRVRRAVKVGGDGMYTFQVILYPGGKVVYQYLNMYAPTNSATVGWQNASGTDGSVITRDTPYVHDGLAVVIQSTPDWLTVSPSTGTCAPGSSVDITVQFAATGLAPGDYRGKLTLLTNDPQAPRVDMSVDMQVAATTSAGTLLPETFALTLASGNPSHGATTFQLAMPRRAGVDLCVYDVRGALRRHVVAAPRDPGYHRLAWDGCDDRGAPAPAGVYFVRARIGQEFEKTLRVVLLR